VPARRNKTMVGKGDKAYGPEGVPKTPLQERRKKVGEGPPIGKKTGQYGSGMQEGTSGPEKGGMIL